MIISYSFSNFQSFADHTEVSFRASKRIPETSWIAETTSDLRIAKVLGVVGANASGKTGLLKPIPFLAWFISGSFLTDPTAPIPFQPHFSRSNEPSEFAVEIDYDDKIWRYVLRLTPSRVIHEALYVKKERFNYVFIRDWDEGTESYIVKQQDFGMAMTEAKKVRPNASLIATAAQYGVPLAVELASLRIATNVNAYGRVLNSHNELIDAAYFFGNNDQHKMQMCRLLSTWDLGLSDVQLREIVQTDVAGKPIKQWRSFGIHKSHGKQHELDFWQESSGTRGAFVLLSQLLPTLERGGIAVIDEFENDLHPHMLQPILDLFANPKTNPKNAQLLFTCHAIEVMNTLPKSQLMLVEKNDECESTAWRLDTVEGIRADDNFYAKYMAGAYGAIPIL